MIGQVFRRLLSEPAFAWCQYRRPGKEEEYEMRPWFSRVDTSEHSRWLLYITLLICPILSIEGLRCNTGRNPSDEKHRYLAHWCWSGRGSDNESWFQYFVARWSTLENNPRSGAPFLKSQSVDRGEWRVGAFSIWNIVVAHH